MVVSKSTSGIQSKRIFGRPYQNFSKVLLWNSPIVLYNISNPEPLIVPTSIIVTTGVKPKDKTPEPSLMKASNRYENKDIVMSELSLLVKQKLTYVEDLLTRNSPIEILLSKNVSEVN